MAKRSLVRKVPAMVLCALFGLVLLYALLATVRDASDERAQLARQRLEHAVMSIESYRMRYGAYPPSLEALQGTAYDDSILLDPFAGNGSFYYYELRNSTYYLFSDGPDGVPFTADDVSLDLTDDDGSLGYRLP